jgi:archaeosine synthase beta-subunit
VKCRLDTSLPIHTLNAIVQPRPYPNDRNGRDQWILERRAGRPGGDTWQPHGWFMEHERSASGCVAPVLTVLLRSRECPWRCLMCDLWKFTVEQRIPERAIVAQLDRALAEARQNPHWPEVRQIKLYNAGSYFDAGAVPTADDGPMAARLRPFERVIVECHPALINQRAVRFRDLLESSATPASEPRLEVAMGLETAHPDVLEKLNKRMTLDQFRRAAEWLTRNRIALRAFVLVRPPFMKEDAALEWAKRSIDFAFDCGASAVSLIPTRFGNGALESLAASGQFAPPCLSTVEAALDYGVARGLGRVFADLWEIERIALCNACFAARRARLEWMNRSQSFRTRIACEQCEGST